MVRGKNSELGLLAEETQANHHRKIRQAHGSEIAEDYVEVIADLIAVKGEARATEIARRLGVTHVTVSKTIVRLQNEGLVTSEPYRSIFLTKKGEQMAEKSRERHEIVIKFLRALGVSEKTALADAEGIEHHVSDETLRVFKRFVKER